MRLDCVAPTISDPDILASFFSFLLRSHIYTLFNDDVEKLYQRLGKKTYHKMQYGATGEPLSVILLGYKDTYDFTEHCKMWSSSRGIERYSYRMIGPECKALYVQCLFLRKPSPPVATSQITSKQRIYDYLTVHVKPFAFKFIDQPI